LLAVVSCPRQGFNDDACLVASYVDLAAETLVRSSIHLTLKQMMMTLRTQVLVAGAVWGADGRKKVLRLGCVALAASALRRCSNVSLNLPAQLWRSLSPIKKPNSQVVKSTPALPQTRPTRLGQLRVQPVKCGSWANASA
jgi:hypothetical protein